jgi:hypothetical protein
VSPISEGHGFTEYGRGCRCPVCVRQARLYWSRGYNRRKRGEFLSPTAELAAEACLLIQEAYAKGLTRKLLADRAALSTEILRLIETRKAKRIAPLTLAKLRGAVREGSK